MTAYVEALMTEAYIGAQGCPEPMIERTLRSAVGDFYRDTNAWRVFTDITSVVAGDPEVELDLPTGTIINRIYWARLNAVPLKAVSMRNISNLAGTPTGYAVVGGTKVLRLNCKPTQGYITDGLDAEVSVTPLSALDDLPSYLFDAHRDGILYGALAKLLMMPNVPWSNMDGAATYGAMAANIRREAARQAESNQAPIVRIVKYGGI